MKNLISFITLLIFLHSITNYLISTEAKISSVDDPVLDTDGDELLTDTGYYIRPTFRPGGGIIEIPIPDRCTYAVAQLGIMGDGLPLTFFPIKNQTTNVILESTDLKIWPRIPRPRIGCEFSWKVDEYDESTKQYFIVTGGIFGVPDEEFRRRFRIENAGDEYDGAYRFVYCPRVDEFSVKLCRPVGIFFQDRVRRLALDGDSTFTFKFVKSNRTEQLHGLELGR